MASDEALRMEEQSESVNEETSFLSSECLQCQSSNGNGVDKSNAVANEEKSEEENNKVENSSVAPEGKHESEVMKDLNNVVLNEEAKKIRNVISLAKLQVDEKTRSKDAIRTTIQLKKASCKDYHDKFEAAKSEERAARDAFNAIRHEMDSVLSVINRIKNATSIDGIDDIDESIHNMEHQIEYGTVTLKEERQLIGEIKQLKHLHEQLLCASFSRQAEVQPTSEERDRAEERFKLLKQELDSARNKMLQTQGTTREARKTYFDEYEKLKELQGQFRVADDLRQEAYTHLQNLKKQLYDKKTKTGVDTGGGSLL